jgi:hypothetical protein
MADVAASQGVVSLLGLRWQRRRRVKEFAVQLAPPVVAAGGAPAVADNTAGAGGAADSAAAATLPTMPARRPQPARASMYNSGPSDLTEPLTDSPLWANSQRNISLSSVRFGPLCRSNPGPNRRNTILL